MAGIRLGPRLFAALILAALGATVVVLALVLTTTEDDQRSAPALSLGPTYTEAVLGTWRQVNPLLAETEVDRDLVALIFRGLVTTGADGSVQPGLAELPTFDEPGLTLTFRLRDGLRWSDGHTLDSADVSFTIRQLQSPEFRGDPLLAEAWSGVTVETPDGRTVILTLPDPNAPFLARFATVGILPQHLLDQSSGDALSDQEFGVAPVGAGPYRLVELGTKEARLVANPYYRGATPGIVEIRLRFFSDQGDALEALAAGEVDGFMTITSLDQETLASLTDDGRIQALALQGSSAVVLYLNNDNYLLETPDVRRAIALAIDRGTLPWGPATPGATISASPVAPGSWAYVEEFDAAAWIPATATQLLEDQGWVTSGTSGVLTREGSEFRMTIRTDDDPQNMALAAAVAAQLDEVGIRSTVASTAETVLFRDFLQDRKYDSAIVTWDQGVDPDPYDGWHSSQLGSAGLNIANFADPVTDELIALGRTHNQPAVRLDAYRQIQARWNEMMPSIVLGYPRVTYLISSEVTPSLPAILVTRSQRLAAIEAWRR